MNVSNSRLCLTLSCIALYSRTSTTCSIWYVPHAHPPAPRSPPAATATSPRRTRQVPRWVNAGWKHLSTRFIITTPPFIIQLTAVRLHYGLKGKNIYNLLLLLQPLTNSRPPPAGQPQSPPTGENSDGVRQRAGAYPYHQMYSQAMHR